MQGCAARIQKCSSGPAFTNFPVFFPLCFPALCQLNSQKQMQGEQLALSRREIEMQADSLLRFLQEQEEMAKEKAQLSVELTALERHRRLLMEERDTLRYSTAATFSHRHLVQFLLSS